MGRPYSIGVLALGLTGCAQLAGIDETSGHPPDKVSLEFMRTFIGPSLTTEPLDLTGLMAQFLVADDAQDDGLTRVDGELLVPDAWSASIAEGTPAVLFDLPDVPTPILREYDIGARDVKGTFGWMGHPNPEPPPMDAMITLQSTLPSPYAVDESFQLYTLGVWTQRGLTAAELPAAAGAAAIGPITFPYASVGSITGRPLDKLTMGDSVMFLRYVGNKLTGVMEAAPFDQTGTDMIMGTMTPVTADQTLTAMVGPPATVAARYAPVRPAVGNLGMSWSLRAAPGADLSNDNGPLLEAAGVAMADTGALSVPYGNPFVAKGWKTILTWSTSENRTYTPAMSLPVTLYAGLYQYAEPSADLALDLPAGLPEGITLDGKPLSTDGVSIEKPVKAVHVSFVSGITDNTLYSVYLYELVPNAANTALVQKPVVMGTATKPEMVFPPELFEPGKLYNLRAYCFQGGFTGVADGDLSKRALPMAVGYLDGGVFTVMP